MAGNDSTRKRLRSREWVTERSIAGYCMVSPSTVRRWIKDGKLPAIQLPSGQHRVAVDSFKTFLKRHQIPIPEELLLMTLA